MPQVMRLNPEASEFFPNQNPQHLKPIFCSGFVTSLPPPDLNPQKSCCICYPTPASPSLLADEKELTYLFEVTKDHYSMGAQVEPQKQKEVGVAQAVNLKGVAKQRFFVDDIKGFGRRREVRRADGFRLRACVWRPKGKDAGGEKCGPTSVRVLRKPYHSALPVRFDGEDTTIMIRNIPNKFTREKLLEFLDNHCMVENQKKKGENVQNGEEHTVSAFDFVYLPIDFKSGCNKGYAFVNFTNPKSAWKFHLAAKNQKWDLFHSHKIREVATARLQGKQNLQKHFETMNFACDSEDVLPLCFSPPRDGTIKVEQRTLGRLIKLRGTPTTQ